MKVMGRWMPTLALTVCLGMAGCKKEAPPPSGPTAPATPPPTAPPPPAAPPPTTETADAGAGTPADAGTTLANSPEWTAGVVDLRRSDLKPVTLREVRTGSHEGHDRIVFQFDGDQLPGYHIEYVDKPVIKCGSGDPTEVAGQGWLLVRLQPAQAHENGQVTVAERERKQTLPVLQELELTCDFEAEVTWVLGVKRPNKYRVLELSGPTRLVVDVQH